MNRIAISLGNYKVDEYVDADFINKLRQLGFRVYQDTYTYDFIDHKLSVNNQPVIIISGVEIWLVEHKVTLDGFHYVGYRSRKAVVDEIVAIILAKLTL